ncbi:protease [Bifidobacterium bifidum]|uniref:protease n=1 Tax=Bifidobacterium bifidum TaxID=1681 RepID=UPI0034A264FA
MNNNGELLDVYGFHFSAFLLSGDSGGAIVSGHYSIGVDSYGNMSSCDDAADDDAVAGGFAIVDGKYNAEVMSKHGFNLSINVGQPKFAKLAAGQISGMVDAAAGAKVTVTVDGKSYVAIVGNAGVWTVRLPKALAPGSHKVTAVASLQSKGSDFTTTGAAASRKFTL